MDDKHQLATKTIFDISELIQENYPDLKEDIKAIDKVAYIYTLKFIKSNKEGDIRNIAKTSYFLSIKWLIDRHPTLEDYLYTIENIPDNNTKKLKKFINIYIAYETKIAIALNFNFNPLKLKNTI